MNKSARIPARIVPSVGAADMSSRQVAGEFAGLIDAGAVIRVAGNARRDPGKLFAGGLRPRHKIELFDTRFYFTNVRQIPELRFFVGYVVQRNPPSGRWNIFPRIMYKDLSLVWRAASHFTFVNGDIWVGKGDVRYDEEAGHETIESMEATTDLPLEMQTGVERLLDQSRRVRSGAGILEMVLRRGPADRVEPYADFTEPRKRARANRQNLIHGGRRIARFLRKNDPASLRMTPGYAPDFQEGILETSHSTSKLYGGKLSRFRILSLNRKIQYYFIAAARHVWIIPPQATTTALSSFGVRTIDVRADDDLFIPGYEYHYYEETKRGVELYSQIPPGFAGPVCPVDDAKADASPWLDQIPLIRDFRQQVLGQTPVE